MACAQKKFSHDSFVPCHRKATGKHWVCTVINNPTVLRCRTRPRHWPGLQQQQTLTSVSFTCTRAMSTRLSYTILYTRSTNRLKGRVKASDMKPYRDKRGTKQNRWGRKSYSIKADMTDSQSGHRYESPMRLIYWFVGSRLALVTTISIC